MSWGSQKNKLPALLRKRTGACWGRADSAATSYSPHCVWNPYASNKAQAADAGAIPLSVTGFKQAEQTVSVSLDHAGEHTNTTRHSINSQTV
jgi:hypothetical protein